MRLGIDIDDTISNTNEKIVEEALKYDKEYVRGRGFKDKDAYSFMEMFYWNVLNVDGFFKKIHKGDFYATVEPIHDASLYIEKLYQAGDEIVFITKRKNTIKNRRMTKKWLKKYGFKYHKLILGADDKSTICDDLDIDIFIDNDKNNIIDAMESNVICILKGTKYNKKYTEFKRIEEWKDIYNYIEEVRKSGKTC